MLVTVSSEADTSVQASKTLQLMPCIWYLIRFQEGQTIKALINSGRKVNAITLAYVMKLGLTTQQTNIGAQKIAGSPLETHSMALARLSLQDSLGRVWFFEKTFLLAKTRIKIVVEMSFLGLSNSDF